jgi:uncharacterized protein YbjT (DUF2867 family)
MPNTVAIVGITGTLGKPILDALTTTFKSKVQLPVRAVSRDTSKLTSNEAVKYYGATNKEQYKAAFEGVDVVVDLRNPAHIKTPNDPVVNAASEQHVKVFVPSNFGSDFTVTTYGAAIQPKIDSGNEAKSLGLKVVDIDTGLFLDWVYGVIANPQFLSIDIEKGLYSRPGDGETKIAVSFLADIGSYVASAVTKPLDEVPTHLRVYSSITTHNEVAALYEKAKGITLKLEPVSKQSVQDTATEILNRGITGFIDFRDVLKGANLQGANDFSKSKDNEYLNPGLFKTGDFTSAALAAWSKKD